MCERDRQIDRGGQSGRRAHLSGTVTPHESHCQRETGTGVERETGGQGHTKDKHTRVTKAAEEKTWTETMSLSEKNE